MVTEPNLDIAAVEAAKPVQESLESDALPLKTELKEPSIVSHNESPNSQTSAAIQENTIDSKDESIEKVVERSAARRKSVSFQIEPIPADDLTDLSRTIKLNENSEPISSNTKTGNLSYFHSTSDESVTESDSDDLLKEPIPENTPKPNESKPATHAAGIKSSVNIAKEPENEFKYSVSSKIYTHESDYEVDDDYIESELEADDLINQNKPSSSSANVDEEEIEIELVDAEELEFRRFKSQYRLKSAWERIFEKYEHDFEGLSDEINLETGEVF